MLAAARVIPRRADFDGVCAQRTRVAKGECGRVQNVLPPAAPARSAIGDRGNASDEPRGALQPQFGDLIDPEAPVSQIGTGFAFTEGPIWSPREQALYFQRHARRRAPPLERGRWEASRRSAAPPTSATA